MVERHQLTRKKLYDLVWEKPMTLLAKEFGTSSYQLIKICREHRIPTPICGYWSKLKHNKDVPKRPLSENSDLDYKPIIIIPYCDVKTKPKKKKRSTTYVKSPIPIIKTLHSNRLHPIVLKTMNTGFEMDRSREVYELHKPKETCLNITVYPETIRRSLMLADTIIKAIEARGHKFRICVSENKYWYTSQTYKVEECYFDIKGEKVRFAISEKMNQVKRLLTEEGKKELERHGYVRYEYKYLSSGILKVKILEAYYRENTLMDNDKMTVEQQIPLIIKGILSAADRQKKTRIQKKIEDCRRAKEKRLAELKALLEEHEKQRIDDLENQVKKWKQAVAIRNYLNAFEEAMGTDEYRDHGMKYWLEWAYGYADQIDPLSMFNK
jgi:hypothetical protein